MKEFISILLAMLSILYGTTIDDIITAENIKDYLEPNAEAVADFIVDNLSLFAQEYNQDLEDNDQKFNANACEYRIPVYVTSLDKDGVYLDFDGNNGYMIILDNYEIVAFEVTGDLFYLRELEYTYYSIYDGFMYIDDLNNYIPYGFDSLDLLEDIHSGDDFIDEINGKKSYNGQSNKGNDGEIYDPYAFVIDKYGTGYKVYADKLLSGYKYVRQMDLSIYLTIIPNGRRSEGNCSLSSIYSLMYYLSSSGKYPNLPRNSRYYNATNDSFYNKYANNDSYEIRNPYTLPVLYTAIRQYAIDHYGYETSSINPLILEQLLLKLA